MLTKKRAKRKARVRGQIVSVRNPVPRLSVYRSNKLMYGQIIDDATGVSLVAYSDVGLSGGTKVERAKKVGKKIAELAKAKKIERVVFDRSGYAYHGRVAALAEGAREGGLKF